MKQIYSNYTQEDFEVWKTLFNRQVEHLKGVAHEVYLDSLNSLSPALNATKIPNFEELNKLLFESTGWSIEVVPGMIPVRDFFSLLSQKKFCSSTWLRSMKQLDYLEEPDMFHDIFGHIPLLIDKEYANFVEAFGKLGNHYKDDEKMLKYLQRLYWYTIEFGLIKQDTKMQIYGAGILSSFGESKHVYTDNVKVRPFDIDWIINHEFINSEIQNEYVEIDSFSALFNTIKQLEDKLLLIEKQV